MYGGSGTAVNMKASSQSTPGLQTALPVQSGVAQVGATVGAGAVLLTAVDVVGVVVACLTSTWTLPLGSTAAAVVPCSKRGSVESRSWCVNCMVVDIYGMGGSVERRE